MQNINNKLKIGLITGARRVKANAGTAREYYNPSPLFRYRVKYCVQSCDKVYILSPEKTLAKLDDAPPIDNLGLENITGKEFKEWKRNVVETISNTIPLGSTLIFLAGNRFRQLIPLLSAKYTCEEPTKGMDIGKQLNYLIKLLGKENING